MILIRKPVKQEVYDGTFIRPRMAIRYDYMCNDDVPIEFVDVAEAQKYGECLGIRVLTYSITTLNSMSTESRLTGSLLMIVTCAK